VGEQDTAAHFLQRRPIPIGIGLLCFPFTSHQCDPLAKIVEGFFSVEEKCAIRTQNFHGKQIFHDLFAYQPDMSEMSGGRWGASGSESTWAGYAAMRLSAVSSVIFSVMAWAMSMRSNGSLWCGGRRAAVSACSVLMPETFGR